MAPAHSSQPRPRTLTIIPGEKDGTTPGKKPLEMPRPDLFDRNHIHDDPDTIHFPGEGLKGGRVRETVSISPEMHEAIERVVQSPILPWRTSSEFVRYAIYLLLADLARVPEGRLIQTHFATLDAVASTVRTIGFKRELDTVFQHLFDEVQTCLSDGDLTAAKSALIDIETRIKNFPQLPNYAFGRRILERLAKLKKSTKIE